MADGQGQQTYDSSIKALIREFAAEILPHIVAGIEFLQELNVEIIKPTMRADKVFLVRYYGKQHILHLEFESGSDSEMAYRLLSYHTRIFEEHRIPVISVIVYLFPATMIESPLREVSNGEDILTFHFRTLPMWELKAEEYVHQHIMSMYTLLPIMGGASASLLLQAIQEMVEYYQKHETQLARQLKWLSVLLRRTDTVPLEDKIKVQERLKMFDNLLEQDPYIQKIRADQEAKGRIEGRAEGRIEGEIIALQRAIVHSVERRFPALAQMARQQITLFNKPDALYLLLTQINEAPDEAMAGWLLSKSAS